MKRARVSLVLAVVTFAVGCTSGAPDDGRTLRVFAASSLTESFDSLAEAFEETHPGVDVSLTFAGSQVLRLQIERGADADVFASANRAHLTALVDQSVVAQPVVFAQNELVVVVPNDNPARIRSFEGLPDAERIVVGTPAVPVGGYTSEMLERAGGSFRDRVRSRIVSRETNVRQVRARVELGEADAAIVYRTDARATDRVREIAVPPHLNVRADYLLAPVVRSDREKLAGAWGEFLESSEGRGILREYGFIVD